MDDVVTGDESRVSSNLDEASKLGRIRQNQERSSKGCVKSWVREYCDVSYYSPSEIFKCFNGKVVQRTNFPFWIYIEIFFNINLS